MSEARKMLLAANQTNPLWPSIVDQSLAVHAHELAERQRDYILAGALNPSPLPDLIDPEAQR